MLRENEKMLLISISPIPTMFSSQIKYRNCHLTLYHILMSFYNPRGKKGYLKTFWKTQKMQVPKTFSTLSDNKSNNMSVTLFVVCKCFEYGSV